MKSCFVRVGRQWFELTAEMSEDERRRKIKDKWFLGELSQGNLMHHPLAGLWWGVKLTVCEERGEGKYNLTGVLLRDLDFLTRTLGTYQLGRFPKAMKGILGYMFDHPDDFKSSFEAKTRYIMRHFNSLGGVLHLGCLEPQFYAEELERTKDYWISATRKTGLETDDTTEKKPGDADAEATSPANEDALT